MQVQRNVTEKWRGKLVVALSKPMPPLWGPHRGKRKVVCLRSYMATSTCEILKGSIMEFSSEENRDRWLAATHPRRYERLLKKWERRAL